MPLFYLRRLTGHQRSDTADRHLARYLAFVAGAANAGGFLAVRQYTSHMSGTVSFMADNLATGQLTLFYQGLWAVGCFVCGAISTTLLIRWAKTRELHSIYAIPLLIEALLLSVSSLAGYAFWAWRAAVLVTLLCFTMGMQNAMITKLSNSVIRTTHVTGILTDLGIALGRIFFGALRRDSSSRAADVAALGLLSSLVGSFFAGGVTGALGFKEIGVLFTLPLAVGLLFLSSMPVIDDMRRPLRAVAVQNK